VEAHFSLHGLALSQAPTAYIDKVC